MYVRNLIFKVVSIGGILAIFTLAWASPARAFESMTGNDVVVPAGEVIEEDLYVGAANFTLEGTIAGDLIVFGSTIRVGSSGVVEGDLIAAGQSVTLDGIIMYDARVAGYSVQLGPTAEVSGDLVAAGYSLEAKQDSQIGGDVLFGGYQASLAGDIGGDVNVGGNGLELQGSIGGNVLASLGSAQDTAPFSPVTFMPNMPPVPAVAGGLTVGEDAEILGDLDYTSSQIAAVPAGAVAGEVTQDEPAVSARQERQERSPLYQWFLDNLRNFLALLVVGLLLTWLLPMLLKNGADALQMKPLPSFGWGLVAYFGFYLAVLVLLALVAFLVFAFGVITLGRLLGLSIVAGILTGGSFVLFFILAASYLSKIVVGYTGGRWVLGKISPGMSESRIWPLVIGVIILALLVAIPYVGWVINAIFILLGLGALWIVAADRLRARQAVPSEPT